MWLGEEEGAARRVPSTTLAQSDRFEELFLICRSRDSIVLYDRRGGSRTVRLL